MSDESSFEGFIEQDNIAKEMIVVAGLQEIDFLRHPMENERIADYVFGKKSLEDGSVSLSLVNIAKKQLVQVFRIFPDFMNSDLKQISPSNLYQDFFDNFGEEHQEIDNKKYLMDFKNKIIVLGKVKSEQYFDALKKHGIIH